MITEPRRSLCRRIQRCPATPNPGCSYSESSGEVVAQGEDTQIVILPFQQALEMVTRGEICDAKTILALQHLALHIECTDA